MSMLISLSEVPRRERHLLYCSDPRIEGRPRKRRRRLRHRAALNRSIAPLGERIDLLLPIPAAAGFDAAGNALGSA